MFKIADLESLDSGSQGKYDDSIKAIFQKLYCYGINELKEHWQKKLTLNEINLFLKILENYFTIKWKWLKILNNELEYPKDHSLKNDKVLINNSSLEDALSFEEIVYKLSPIEISLPATTKLEKLFITSQKETLEKVELIDFLKKHLELANSLIFPHIHDKGFATDIAENIITPSIMKYVKEYEKQSPNYRKFVKKRESRMKEIQQQAVRTNQAVRIPREEFDILYKQMVTNFERDKAFSSVDQQALLNEIQKSFLKKHDLEYPKLIEENSILNDAIAFNLTVGLSLLKKVIKFLESRNIKFLNENYILIKKKRNQLSHGDYLLELAGKEMNEIVHQLYECIGNILKDLEEIRLNVEKSSSEKLTDKKSIKTKFSKASFKYTPLEGAYFPAVIKGDIYMEVLPQNTGMESIESQETMTNLAEYPQNKKQSFNQSNQETDNLIFTKTAKINNNSFSSMNNSNFGSPITASGDTHNNMLKEIKKIKGINSTDLKKYIAFINQKQYGKTLRTACNSCKSIENDKGEFELIKIIISYKEKLSINIKERNSENKTAID